MTTLLNLLLLCSTRSFWSREKYRVNYKGRFSLMACGRAKLSFFSLITQPCLSDCLVWGCEVLFFLPCLIHGTLESGSLSFASRSLVTLAFHIRVCRKKKRASLSVPYPINRKLTLKLRN